MTLARDTLRYYDCRLTVFFCINFIWVRAAVEIILMMVISLILSLVFVRQRAQKKTRDSMDSARKNLHKSFRRKRWQESQLTIFAGRRIAVSVQKLVFCSF